MPLRALTSLLALALALGALVVGQVVIVPMISAGGPLADANLANALARPVSLRLAEAALVAAAVFWMATARGWPRGALSTLSGAGFALCVLDRAYLLPRSHGAAELVDLVTQAPAVHAAALARTQLIHQLAVASACVLLCAAAVLLARRLETERIRSLAPGAPLESGEPAAEPHRAYDGAPSFA